MRYAFSFLFLLLFMFSSCSKTPLQDTELAKPGTVLLFLTITDTTPKELDLSLGNPSNTVRSAVSTDGYTFTLLPESWITHGDMADPAVALGNDNLWMVASGTFFDSLLGRRNLAVRTGTRVSESKREAISEKATV